MGASKRQLNRIDQKITDAFTCVIECNGTKMYAKLINYNSLSLMIFSPQFFDHKYEQIDQIDLFLGERVICSYTNPKIARIDPADGTVAIELQRNSEKIFNPELRCELNYVRQGIFCGEDPLSIGTTIFFRIKDISVSGLRLVTTKNNRHITPGLQLYDFDLTFPGFQALKASVKIVNAQASDDMLEFGCVFLDPSKILKLVIQKNLIANLDANEVDLSHLIKSQKNFRGHIRMALVSGDSEYQEILKLRWRAYRNEGKILEDTDVQGMKDDYDPRSLIYAVQIGKTVVATFRLVFAKRNEDLPFEKYFEYEKIERFKNCPRSQVIEISRLAIDPIFQGSDILVTIIRNLVVELTIKVKVKYSACLATRDLAKYYTAFGAIPITDEVPHPNLKDGHLRLYYFDNENFFMKEMNSFGWFKIARPTIKFLNRFRLPVKYPMGIKYYFRFISDITLFTIARQRRKMKRRNLPNKTKEKKFPNP